MASTKTTLKTFDNLNWGMHNLFSLPVFLMPPPDLPSAHSLPHPTAVRFIAHARRRHHRTGVGRNGGCGFALHRFVEVAHGCFCRSVTAPAYTPSARRWVVMNTDQKTTMSSFPAYFRDRETRPKGKSGTVPSVMAQS